MYYCFTIISILASSSSFHLFISFWLVPFCDSGRNKLSSSHPILLPLLSGWDDDFVTLRFYSKHLSDYRFADSDNDGERFLRETEQADDEHLTHHTAAGSSGQNEGTEDGYGNGPGVHIHAREGHTEDPEQEGGLHDGAQDGTIHVHGGTERQHDVANVFGDPDFITGFHVGRDGCAGALGPEGGDRRFQDAAPEGLHAPAAPCIEGVRREEDDGVCHAHGLQEQIRRSVRTGHKKPIRSLGWVFCGKSMC